MNFYTHYKVNKMKVGIEVQIDVKKIDKARLFAGKKGTYLTMTTFVDLDEQDQYDNNGFISHKKDKDEQGNTPILGNVKVFWKDQQQAPQQNYQQQAPQQQAPVQQSPMAQNPNASNPAPQMAPADDFDDDIPFR